MPVSAVRPLSSSPHVPGLADVLQALSLAIDRLDVVVDQLDDPAAASDAASIGFGLRIFFDALQRIGAPPVLQVFGDE